MEILELFTSLQHKKCWFGWLCLKSRLFFRVAEWLIHSCGKQGVPKNWARLMFAILSSEIISNWGCCVKRGLWLPPAFSFLAIVFAHTYRNCSWLAGWLDWVSGTSIDCIPPALHFWPIVARQLEMGSHASERGRETDAAVAAIFKCFYRKLTGCHWEENLNKLYGLQVTKSVGVVLQIWIIHSSKVLLYSALYPALLLHLVQIDSQIFW